MEQTVFWRSLWSVGLCSWHSHPIFTQGGRRAAGADEKLVFEFSLFLFFSHLFFDPFFGSFSARGFAQQVSACRPGFLASEGMQQQPPSPQQQHQAPHMHSLPQLQQHRPLVPDLSELDKKLDRINAQV